jgi:hypothetical protein
MEINSIIDNFIQKAAGKYRVAQDDNSPEFRWPIASQDWQRTVLTLNRLARTDAFARTVLVASGSSDAELEEVYKWCAYVKGNLLDPETADLYLFLVYNEPIPELEVCLQVEANELYCRKFVLRPQERFDDLLNRSFLSEPAASTVGQERSEPLKQALLETAVNFPWLNGGEMERWRQILLADGSGNELSTSLYQQPSNND